MTGQLAEVDIVLSVTFAFNILAQMRQHRMRYATAHFYQIWVLVLPFGAQALGILVLPHGAQVLGILVLPHGAQELGWRAPVRQRSVG